MNVFCCVAQEQRLRRPSGVVAFGFAPRESARDAVRSDGKGGGDCSSYFAPSAAAPLVYPCRQLGSVSMFAPTIPRIASTITAVMIHITRISFLSLFSFCSVIDTSFSSHALRRATNQGSLENRGPVLGVNCD